MGISVFQVLIAQIHFSLVIPSLGMPFGEFLLTIESLSAFFVLVLSLAVIPNALYSIGYLNRETQGGQTALFCSLYHLFILSLYGVFSASKAILFLIFWECMTLTSFLFILTNRGHGGGNEKAGYLPISERPV